MTAVEPVVVITAGVWMAVLTLAVLLCVSQLTILTRRIEIAVGPVSAMDSGPDIGMRVPLEAEHLLVDDPDGELILLMSATCGPCRSVAEGLSRDGYDEGSLTILLPGSNELAGEIASQLSSTVTVVRDPDANRYARALGIVHTPFALAVLGRTVVGKSPVNQVADLRRLHSAIAEIDRRSLPLVEVGGSE